MWKALRSLFAPATRPPHEIPDGQSYTIREGLTVPTDQAFDAWTSMDLDKMLLALGVQTNTVDRHFLLMNIVRETYRQRQDPSMRQKCREIAQLHLHEFPVIAPALKREFDGVLLQVPTFQNYATVLTEGGEFDEAVAVCEMALMYGLSDGTKSGYKGRISRIRGKQQVAGTQQAHPADAHEVD